MRRLLRPEVKKVGHAGTLDPFATGLLIVLVGRATRLARFFVDLPKEYVGTVRFGLTSDTGDCTGELSPTGRSASLEEVSAVLPRFIGHVTQTVPMTSAVKVDGERLYKKAHRGEVVATPTKEVEISSIDALAFDAEAQTMLARVVCSKGTYVRQLAIDIGAAVGAGAYLEELARAAIGPFRLEDAQSLAEFEGAVTARADGDERIPGLVTPDRALQFLPALEIGAAQVAGVRNGARLSSGPQETARVVHRGELLAVYGPSDDGRGLKLMVML
ncbi:MAG TPA: tRNA pseudouridine(55) synthase TruB [Thermoleophilia bacterium]|nr:tRNA pseudouridine(55) synthase TruB [Thermoleophilia bacterium]